MKLDTIKDITQTVSDFYLKVISPTYYPEWDKFLVDCAKECASLTVQCDESVDIDYGNMTFTVSKRQGKALLSPIATYNHNYGDATDIDGIKYTMFNIELFEE